MISICSGSRTYAQKTRKLRADAIPTEYLESVVNKVPDETVTAQSIGTEGQSNVEHQIVEYFNDSLYSQSFDTDAKEKTVKQSRNVQRMCQRLLARNKYLEGELFKQRKRVKVNSDIRVRKILSSIFTSGQIKLLLNPHKKKTHWSSEDIAAAISLRTVSPKAYRYLQKARNVPLPALSTLRRWVVTFNVDNGILEHVFLIMKHKGQNMTNMDKITTLYFDEIHLSNQAAIERRQERVIGPHEKCQVAVSRGLFTKWKQPVYYE